MAGYTSNSNKKEVNMPPIMGAAIRFMTSEPVPMNHKNYDPVFQRGGWGGGLLAMTGRGKFLP